MYYEHFGLTQAPFKITPNTDFFFTGGNRGPVLDALVYAITRGEGIVKVTGEVGSGKTMLCNMLQNRLPDTVESVYLANPNVAPEEVLEAIAFELQLGLDRQADRLEVMHALQDYLVQQHAEGKRIVVFIEESQSMPIATLEEIRLLSNLETRNDKLLQIVLFGQPELDENLRRPEIRQLRDRIAHSFRLQPLAAEDVRNYLMFRMRAAGYRGPELFSPAVVKRIAKASGGLTRRINLIADKALLAAYAEDTHTLHAKHVQAALKDSEFGDSRAGWDLAPRPALAWTTLTLLIGAAAGAGLYGVLNGHLSKPTAVDAAPAPFPTAHTTPASSIAAPSPSGAVGEALEVRTAGPITAGAQIASTPVTETPNSRVVAAAVSGDVGTKVVATPVKLVLTDNSPSVRVSRNGDLIERRLEATQTWLSAPAGATYSIQLFVANDEQQLRKHLNVLAKFVEINDLYMYRSEAQGRPVVNVLWRSFRDRKEATAELADLPTPLRANRPYVRALSVVRAELEQHRDIARR